MEPSLAHTLHDVLRGHSRRMPDAVALVEPGYGPLTYSNLWQKVERTNAFLNARGIGRGDHVAMIVERPSDAMAAFLALACSTTVVALNPEMTSAELEAAIIQTRAKAVVFSTGVSELAETAKSLGVTPLSLESGADGTTGSFELRGGRHGKADRPGFAQPEDTLAILMSSGTTGKPKAVPVPHVQFMSRSRSNGTSLRMSPDDVCMNFRPPYLSGPLGSGLVLPVLFGGCVVAPNGFDVDGFYAALRDHGVTWYMGGPVYHEAILGRAEAYPETIAASRLRFIRAGSYTLPPETLSRLESTFGVPCIEAYGSTETGAICSNPLPPAKRKPGTVGLPVGCEVVIRDSNGAPLPAGEAGEITVRGQNVFGGYLDDPDRTGAVLVDGWYHTGDLGILDADGYLSVRGRLNEIINRGGQKVSPSEVEAVLAAHPATRSCVCFGVPHPTLGQVVVAAIVADPDAEPEEAELRAFTRERLSQFKVPARIVVWREIPHGPLGKPLRKEAATRFVREQSVSRPASASLPTRARTPLQTTVGALWCQVLAVEHIENNVDFFEAGGDSLRVEELLAAIEETHGVSLPFEVIFDDGNTISGMANVIANARKAQGPDLPGINRSAPPETGQHGYRQVLRQAYNRLAGRPRFDGIPLSGKNWLQELVRRMHLTSRDWPGTPAGGAMPLFLLNPNGHLPPLFWCFNGAEEPAAMARLLGPSQPLYAMRSLNRVIGDKTGRSDLVEHIARLYTRELVRLHPSGAFLLGGNCQSGEFAEAIAHNLLALRREVALLALLEYQPEKPFPGRVAMFFGRDSQQFNPFLTEAEPHSRWQRLHAQAVWDVIPGDHGQYFRPPHDSTFMEHLRFRLAEASGLAPIAGKPGAPASS